MTSVVEVADIYSSKFVELRRKRAEAKFLAPLGFDAETFRISQQTMNSAVGASLVERILDETLGVQAIVAGTDASGAHIYTVGVEGGETCIPVCHDGRDYVAIGTGYRQFETQFISLGYDARSQSLQAVLLMYLAKKRAEISPGVGSKFTDGILIADSNLMVFTDEQIKALDSYSMELEDALQKSRQDVFKRMRSDPRLAETTPPPQQSTSTLSG